MKQGPLAAGTGAHRAGLSCPQAQILNMSGVTQVLEPRTRLWNPCLGGTQVMENSTLPFPQKDTKLLRAGQNPQIGRISPDPWVHPSSLWTSYTRNPDRKACATASQPPEFQIPWSSSQDLSIGSAITSTLTLPQMLVWGLRSQSRDTHALQDGASRNTPHDWACSPEGTLPVSVAQTHPIRRNLPCP